MTLTILTPVYNRGEEIKKLFESLKRQSVFDFEWLIVDDGSTDNLSENVERWQETGSGFPIEYLYKENDGKHTAVNLGVSRAQGEYILICDSDDYLTDNAVETVISRLDEISGQNLAGISGQRINEKGEFLIWQKTEFREVKTCGGNPLFDDYVDADPYEAVHKYGMWGDKAEVIKTSVMKKYPFPEYKGEKFISEGVVFNEMAKDGQKLRWYKDPLIVCEYREDGLTRNLVNHLVNSPKGWARDIVLRRELGDDVRGDLKEYYKYMYKTLGDDKTAQYLEIDDCVELKGILKEDINQSIRSMEILKVLVIKANEAKGDAAFTSQIEELKNQVLYSLMNQNYEYYKMLDNHTLDEVIGFAKDELSGMVKIPHI